MTNQKSPGNKHRSTQDTLGGTQDQKTDTGTQKNTDFITQGLGKHDT